MSDKPKPKRTITPEQRAKMDAGRKAAAERRKKEREEEKARKKQELAEEKKKMKEAEKQQKDRLKNAEKDNAAKKRIKKELEQLKESMKIETKKPIPKEELSEVLDKVVEEVAEEVVEVVEEKNNEVIEEKEEEKPKEEPKPQINKTQLESLFKAKVNEMVANINDENARDIFLDTANNYDWNDSVDNNINRLMSRAKSRFESNKQAIEIKTQQIEEKAKNDEYERVQLEKKKRMERLKARYNKLMRA